MTLPEDLIDFCRAEHPRLVGLLSLYCGDRSVAEELAQEALARACRDWRRVRSHDNPGAWVQRVAFNLARSHFRRRRVEQRAQARLDRAPEATSDDPADAIALRRAVAALPRRQKEALCLRYFLDLPIAEIAERLGCPDSTAKSLVRRGLARLRRDGALADTEEDARVT